jgi:hypothetical protein
MKRSILLTGMIALAAIALYAAQDASLTLRQVRDPVQLRTALNANAADTQARMVAVETGVTVTNAAAAFTVATNNIATLQGATSAGFLIANTTQLVFAAAGVTNVIDADITH